MKNVRDEVANNLQSQRKKNKLTQKALAGLLGVSHNTISQWENGTNAIDMDSLFTVCEIFKVSVNDMYGKYSNDLMESFTSNEKQLLLDYRKLNKEGMEYIRQTMEMAVSMEKYKKYASVSNVENTEIG